ncbi:unnamed protein product [Closterium sp. Naga37s-1]|nr:unnamed protein product [Closterium sp. Naga37s-1]
MRRTIFRDINQHAAVEPQPPMARINQHAAVMLQGRLLRKSLASVLCRIVALTAATGATCPILLGSCLGHNTPHFPAALHCCSAPPLLAHLPLTPALLSSLVSPVSLMAPHACHLSFHAHPAPCACHAPCAPPLGGAHAEEDVADTRELATAVAEATALHAASMGGEQGAEEEWRRERAREMAVLADLRGDAPPTTIPLTIQAHAHLLPPTSLTPTTLTTIPTHLHFPAFPGSVHLLNLCTHVCTYTPLRSSAPLHPSAPPFPTRPRQDPRKYFDAATQRDTVHTQQRDTVHTQQKAGQAAVPHAMDLDGPGPATESTPAGTHATLAASLAAFGSELAGGGSGGSSREHRKRGGGGKGGATVMAPAAAAQEVEEFGRQVAVARRGVGEAAEQSLLKQLPDALRTSVLAVGWVACCPFMAPPPLALATSLLRAHGEAVKELLSHFWATYPLTSAALLAKAERHKEGISKLYDRLQVTHALIAHFLLQLHAEAQGRSGRGQPASPFTAATALLPGALAATALFPGALAATALFPGALAATALLTLEGQAGTLSKCAAKTVDTGVHWMRRTTQAACLLLTIRASLLSRLPFIPFPLFPSHHHHLTLRVAPPHPTALHGAHQSLDAALAHFEADTCWRHDSCLRPTSL